MKILHIIPSISPQRGGPSTAVISMVDALRQQGVDASLITTNDDGPDHDLPVPLSQWFLYKGVPTQVFKRWKVPNAALREYAISIPLSCWLKKHIHLYDILHIHALFSYPSTFSMLQARLARKPYILRTIGQLNHWSLAQSSFKKKLMLNAVEYQNISNAAALHFTTSAEMSEALDIVSPKSSFVLPIGVELNSLSKPLEQLKTLSEKTTFLYLSRIHPKKQLDRLIQALSILKQEFPQCQWELLIAGDSSDSAYIFNLKKLMKKMAITHHCKWLGYVGGEKKWNLLANADWFVLPSASENFGIAVAEALSVGTPAIISTHVGISDLIRRYNAGIVTNSDVNDLAYALFRAASLSKLNYSKAAQSLVKDNYAWPKIAENLVQYYRNILSSQKISLQ